MTERFVERVNWYRSWARSVVLDPAVTFPATRIIASVVGVAMDHPRRQLHPNGIADLGRVVGLTREETLDALAELVETGHVQLAEGDRLLMAIPDTRLTTMDDLRRRYGGTGNGRRHLVRS